MLRVWLPPIFTKLAYLVERMGEVGAKCTINRPLPASTCASRLRTLHLIVHDLLVFLVVPVAIAMPAPHGIGDRMAVAQMSQWPTALFCQVADLT